MHVLKMKTLKGLSTVEVWGSNLKGDLLFPTLECIFNELRLTRKDYKLNEDIKSKLRREKFS